MIASDGSKPERDMSGVEGARQNRLLQRLVSDFQAVLVPPPYHQSSPRPPSHVDLRYTATIWVIGAVLMALVTWVGVELNLERPDAPMLAYLVVIVLMSLMDSFPTSAIFSVIAVACLDYFFVEPRRSFAVESTQDLVVLAAFALMFLGATVKAALGYAVRQQSKDSVR